MTAAELLTVAVVAVVAAIVTVLALFAGAVALVAAADRAQEVTDPDEEEAPDGCLDN